MVLTFACLGHFGPHLLDTLQNHVAMPVKSFNSAEEFLVVSAIDQNLCVILDGLCQNWQRSCVEFFLLASFKLFWSHLRLGFIHNRGRHPGYFRQKSANVSDLRRIFVALFWYSTFPVFKYRIQNKPEIEVDIKFSIVWQQSLEDERGNFTRKKTQGNWFLLVSGSIF